MFGAAKPPQNESTAFHPRSPYGAAKVYSYWMAVNHREAYGLFTCNGILFNGESRRRGETFVTITRVVAQYCGGKPTEIVFGQSARPARLELCAGIRAWHVANPAAGTAGGLRARHSESHTVEEFVTEAFEYAGLDWREHVEMDTKYVRPTEVESLLADSTKARKVFGWEPKTEFTDLLHIMVDADLDGLSFAPIGKGKLVLQHQFGDWHQWDKSVSHTLRAASGGRY